VLIISLFWIDDHKDTREWHARTLEHYDWIHNPLLYVHSNSAEQDRPGWIYHDILMHRHRAFYHLRRWDLLGGHWTDHTPHDMFTLTDIPKHKSLPKILLSPNRVYAQHLKNGSPRMQYRQWLRSAIAERHHDIAVYTTDHHQIEPQCENPQIRFQMNSDGSIWFPVHNKYYNSTVFSAYVETLTKGPARGLTEKTWDPIQKGHFVLPFGYCGTVKDCADYGIELPDFIDYGYDSIKNHQQRWDAYINELDRLCGIDRTKWRNLYQGARSLLIKNRQCLENYQPAKLIHSVQSQI
jgi:hypothetical protein